MLKKMCGVSGKNLSLVFKSQSSPLMLSKLGYIS